MVYSSYTHTYESFALYLAVAAAAAAIRHFAIVYVSFVRRKIALTPSQITI